MLLFCSVLFWSVLSCLFYYNKFSLDFRAEMTMTLFHTIFFIFVFVLFCFLHNSIVRRMSLLNLTINIQPYFHLKLIKKKIPDVKWGMEATCPELKCHTKVFIKLNLIYTLNSKDIIPKAMERIFYQVNP